MAGVPANAIAAFAKMRKNTRASPSAIRGLIHFLRGIVARLGTIQWHFLRSFIIFSFPASLSSGPL
jgi:hypothetical protein